MKNFQQLTKEELAQLDYLKDLDLTVQELLRVSKEKGFYPLVPLPENALINGSLREEFLLDIMQNLNQALNYALSLNEQDRKKLYAKNLGFLNEVRIVYVECLDSIEINNIDDKKLTAIDYSVKIIENKMSKLGLNPQEIKASLKNAKNKVNSHFYSVTLDNGQSVLLSSGVIMKGILQNKEIDFTFINECLEENEFVRGFVYSDSFLEQECYIMNPMFSNRLALDFASIQNNEVVLSNYVANNKFKELTPQEDKQAIKDIVCFEDVKGQTCDVPNCKQL